MSLLEAIGEREEARGGRTVLPESRYIMRLTVEETGVTEASERSPGGTPYLQLNGSVLEGPFEGTDASIRLFLSPGKVKVSAKTGTEYGGGFLSFLLGATRKITGKPANEDAFAQNGFDVPEREAGESDRDFGFRLRLAISQWYAEQEPAVRLKTMLALTRANEWDGKVVVAGVNLEEQEYTGSDGEQRTGYRNSWGSFTTLDDAKHGKAFVRAVEHVKQQAAIDAQASA